MLILQTLFKELSEDGKSIKMVYSDKFNGALKDSIKNFDGPDTAIVKALIPNKNNSIKKRYLLEDHPNFINIKRLKSTNALNITYTTLSTLNSKLFNKRMLEMYKKTLPYMFRYSRNSLGLSLSSYPAILKLRDDYSKESATIGFNTLRMEKWVNNNINHKNLFEYFDPIFAHNCVYNMLQRGNYTNTGISNVISEKELRLYEVFLHILYMFYKGIDEYSRRLLVLHSKSATPYTSDMASYSFYSFSKQLQQYIIGRNRKEFSDGVLNIIYNSNKKTNIIKEIIDLFNNTVDSIDNNKEEHLQEFIKKTGSGISEEVKKRLKLNKLYYPNNKESVINFTKKVVTDNMNTTFISEIVSKISEITQLRNQIKVGKFINKLFNYYSSSDIEAFTKVITTSYELKEKKHISIDPSIKIVSGYDIAYYYNVANYSAGNENKTKALLDMSINGSINFDDNIIDGAEANINHNLGGGSLYNSCMRYDRVSRHRLHFYCENKNSIRMLIHTDKNNRATARTILWKGINGDNYFDRVYAANDLSRNNIYNWLIKNKYLNINSSNYNYPSKLDLSNKKVTMVVEKTLFKEYPYLDSLRYIDIQNGFISNHSGTIKSSSEIYEIAGGNGILGIDGRGRPEIYETLFKEKNSKESLNKREKYIIQVNGLRQSIVDKIRNGNKMKRLKNKDKESTLYKCEFVNQYDAFFSLRIYPNSSSKTAITKTENSKLEPLYELFDSKLKKAKEQVAKNHNEEKVMLENKMELEYSDSYNYIRRVQEVYDGAIGNVGIGGLLAA